MADGGQILIRSLRSDDERRLVDDYDRDDYGRCRGWRLGDHRGWSSRRHDNSAILLPLGAPGGCGGREVAGHLERGFAGGADVSRLLPVWDGEQHGDHVHVGAVGDTEGSSRPGSHGASEPERGVADRESGRHREPDSGDDNADGWPWLAYGGMELQRRGRDGHGDAGVGCWWDDDGTCRPRLWRFDVQLHLCGGSPCRYVDVGGDGDGDDQCGGVFIGRRAGVLAGAASSDLLRRALQPVFDGGAVDGRPVRVLRGSDDSDSLRGSGWRHHPHACGSGVDSLSTYPYAHRDAPTSRSGEHWIGGRSASHIDDSAVGCGCDSVGSRTDDPTRRTASRSERDGGGVGATGKPRCAAGDSIGDGVGASSEHQSHNLAWFGVGDGFGSCPDDPDRALHPAGYRIGYGVRPCSDAENDSSSSLSRSDWIRPRTRTAVSGATSRRVIDWVGFYADPQRRCRSRRRCGCGFGVRSGHRHLWRRGWCRSATDTSDTQRRSTRSDQDQRLRSLWSCRVWLQPSHGIVRSHQCGA